MEERDLPTRLRNMKHPIPTRQKALAPQQLETAINAQPPEQITAANANTPGLGVLGAMGYNNVLTLRLAHEADEIPPWGTLYRDRDMKLRELWPTESVIAGAIPTLAARNAAFSVTLDGPERTVDLIWRLFHSADMGAGWLSLIIKLSIDVYTQDNGAFLAMARETSISAEKALELYHAGKLLPPVTGLEHLDAAYCIRTGNALYPVVWIEPYTGKQTALPWHAVIPIAEMPSPVKYARGLQYCALTRILKAAQFMRDVQIYRREKVSGRFFNQINFVGGPSNKAIQDAMELAQERAGQKGLLRYIEPLIVASIDPTKPVSSAVIEWASLPAGFDFDAELRNYITELALDLLEDYQTFAPLASGALGSSQQSNILNLKSKGKGPGLWKKLFSHIMNFNGIIPSTVEFSFEETDPAAEKEAADTMATKINTHAAAIQAGILTPQVSRQILVDEGVLTEEYMAMMGEEDATPDTTRSDEQTAQDVAAVAPIPGGAPAPQTPVVAEPAPGVPATKEDALRTLTAEIRAARKDLRDALNARD